MAEDVRILSKEHRTEYRQRPDGRLWSIEQAFGQRAALLDHADAMDEREKTLIDLVRKMRKALGTMPLWTPALRSKVFEKANKDPLYGSGPKYYPASVLVDSEKLMEARKIYDETKEFQ